MSEAEPCPECKGRCCRDSDFGGRVYHMGAECYYHWCDFCRDGEKYVPPRTAEEERADVLAYIERAIADPFPVPPVLGPEAYLTALYDYIAAGNHEGHAARRKP